MSENIENTRENLKDILSSPLFFEVENIRNICLPLKLINVENFFFHRIYPDGTMIHLSTDVIWGEHFLNKLFSLDYEHADINSHLYIENNISLWEMNDHSQVWQDGREYFNVGNGISVLSQENNQYKEISCFYGSRFDCDLNSFYLNNLDILQSFIMFFKDKASRLINEFESERIRIPEKYRVATDTQKKCAEHKRVEFLSSIKPKKFFINEKYLTEKEAESLYWLSEGKTSEEIGIILNCSKRTVEKQIEQIKDKLGCYTKSDLIKLCVSNNFENFFRLPN